MPKDMQRNKVAAAEKRLPTPTLDSTRVQATVSEVVRSRWWGTRRPDLRTMGIQFGWKQCVVRPAVPRICLETNPTYLTVMHALAHHLQAKDTVAHGPEFALVYIHLVSRFVGTIAGADLRAAFKAERVKTSTWSPEARAAAQERSLTKRYAEAADRTRELLAKLEAQEEDG